VKVNAVIAVLVEAGEAAPDRLRRGRPGGAAPAAQAGGGAAPVQAGGETGAATPDPTTTSASGTPALAAWRPPAAR
jgi:pyruvate/2-oxoglutarate dehydrogenase complex dihydrolipoamide acyltransferase (E2) component